MQRKAIVVKDAQNGRRPDLAYFPEDAFDLFDSELSAEQREYYAKQLTASVIAHLRADRSFDDAYLPINILSFIRLHDGTFSIFIQDRYSTYQNLSNRGQNGKPTGLHLTQTETHARTLAAESVEFHYDFAYPRNPVIYPQYISQLRQTKKKQLEDFLNGSIQIIPPATVSPELLRPVEQNAKAAKKSATFFDVDGIRERTIARLNTLSHDQEHIKKILEQERQKVAAIADERLKHFAQAQFEKLEIATKIKLQSLATNTTELQGTLEAVDAQLITAWNARIDAAVQIEHAKKLLICAIYNAAIEYFIEIQKKNEGRKEKINELNTCFAGIIKFEEDGTFTPVEDAYNNLLTRFSDIKLKEYCEGIIARCNTSKVLGFTVGTSTKMQFIIDNIQRYALKHEHSEFAPVFRLDGLKLSFTFNQETVTKKLDAEEVTTRGMLADLSQVLTSQLKSIESDLQNSQIDFDAFTSTLKNREELLKTINELGVLRRGCEVAEGRIKANIERITALQSDSTVSGAVSGILSESDFEMMQINLQTYIQTAMTNTDASSLFISDEDCEQDKRYQLRASQRKSHAKQAMRNIVEIEKTIVSILAKCNEASRKIEDEQAIAAARAQQQLLAAVAELEGSSDDLTSSNGSKRNLISDAGRVNAEPRLEAVVEVVAPREPEKPGFFKRHLAKLIGGSTGAVVGAGIGAAIGFLLLPVTFGLSVPLFAAIGGVVGGAAVGVGVGAGIGAIVDSTPPEPKKPGFFKRHLAKFIGGSTGAVVGAGIGAAVGFALLPFTFGLSVPLFAAIGGVIGGAVVGVGVGAGIGAAVDRSSAKKRIARDAGREGHARSFRSSNADIYGVVPPGPGRDNTHRASSSPVNASGLSQGQLDLYQAAVEAEQVAKNLSRSFH